MPLHRVFAIALCVSLTGCFPASRSNARIKEGYGVAVSAGASVITERHESPTQGASTPHLHLELQHAWRFAGGDGFAIKLGGPWPNLDLYYAFEDHQGDRWFFGVGADVGLPGQGPYAVATYYFYKELYLTFTPQVPLPVDGTWLAPQLALGVGDFSAFIKYMTLVSRKSIIETDTVDSSNYDAYEVWTMGARASF